jgi:hypothetical protein
MAGFAVGGCYCGILGGVAARGIRHADAANLHPISDPAGERKRGVVKTTRERAEEKRQEKLDLVRQQQESGSLVIRKMTEDERRRYPPRPQPPRRGRR